MFTKEEAKEIVRKIVERFEYHLDEYKKGNYNETQTRNDFINPFFEALGWDINNKQGLAESYREVIHEDKIKIGGHTKAPDYCFTIYGQRKFFVEAKKPSVSIKENTDPAYQLRRYGWSAKMPISIITDFEELSIYDCTIKPTPQDKASVARINYLTYKDYLKEFDFLWDTFSKEMVLKGSFDKFVSSNKGKKGTADVDAEFLKSLDSWRDLLARNIVNRNKEIDEDTLNFSLQKIMDRMIFLRICEDRGIEPENTLFETIGSNIYEKLKTIFHIADQKYNSGLFDYRKDSITDSLSFDDIVLKTIIEEMYYPKCPYEFSVIPVEILGHSYEQYLGKVIRITPGHIIKIETKPEVRKAGGVYYTPQYIVDYIVKNTVGKIVEEKTPEEIAVIRICDPACGSGSFLLGAYQFLLDWHRDYYKNNDIKKKEKFLTPDGNLTTAIKKQILLNNIFGVDIDTNAVEVTKLSLMLKAMEGESNASINEQMQLFHERVLPTLDNNIKSGNSLIDMDFYDSQIDFEPGVEKKIKPFNWESAFPQVFKEKIIGENKEIFHITWVTYNSRVSQRMTEYKNVIIKRRINKGLQPLVDKRELTVEEEIEITKYLKSIIEEDNLNVIEFNICKDHIHILLAIEPKLIDNTIRKLKGKTTQLFKENHNIDNEYHIWAQKFDLIKINDEIQLSNVLNYIKFNRQKHLLPENEELKQIIDSFLKPVNLAVLPKVIKGGFDVVIGNPPYGAELDKHSFEYLKKKYPIGNTDTAALFMILSQNLLKEKGYNGFIIPKPFTYASNWAKTREIILSDIITIVDCSKVWKEVKLEMSVYIAQKESSRYSFESFIRKNETFILIANVEKNLCNEFGFILNGVSEKEIEIGKKIKNNPLTLNDITINKQGIPNQKYTQNEISDFMVIGGAELKRYGSVSKIKGFISKEYITDECAFIKEDSIFVQRIVAHIENPKPHIKIIASVFDKIDLSKNIIVNTVIQLHNKSNLSKNYILGLINSKLISWYSYKFIFANAIRTMQFYNPTTSRIPIPQSPAPETQNRLVSLVETMLQLNKDLQNATLPEQKEQLQARISYTDKKIDTLVYQLYCLTEEEIRLVEGE